MGTAATDEQTRERWRQRYYAALRRLRQAGIETVADEQVGAETYVSLRARWNHYMMTLVPTLAYKMDEIDPAGSRPESAGETQGFRGRLDSAG